MKKNKFMAILIMLLISISSIANSSTSEGEFGIRINFISLLEVQKIKDIDFGSVLIDDVERGMKASGEFKVIGSKNTLVKFKVDQTEELTNGDHTIPMRIYVSNVKDGGRRKYGILSNTGEYYGYLVAKLRNIKGMQLGEYTGNVTLTVEYN